MPKFELISIEEALEVTKETRWLDEKFGEEHDIDMSEKKKTEEGICTKCGGDDVRCLNKCTLHRCVDCGHIQ
jgi:hypothetical protein